MRKKLLVSLSLLGMAAVTIGFLAGGGGDEVSYRYVDVTRGTIESTVSATGSLGAVSTVQVGTQVSGQVAEIRADFNDRVTKGQVIARIDATLLEQQVREAQAGLDRANADLKQKEYAFEQIRGLYEQKVATESEFRTAEYNLVVSKSSVVSAETGLARAKQNLEYSVIYAPIDGIVVERNVDPGQTVAASLSAPQLFLIAEDLSKMQILVSVDESDIGRIEKGQAVRFSVQAYPERTFTGTVMQVRLQSKSSDNVVNYTVVVEVSNAGGELLPGMTATVNFILATADDVLRIPNAALRFRASEAMQAAVRERMAGARNARESVGAVDASGDSARPQSSAGVAGSAGDAGSDSSMQAGAGRQQAGSGRRMGGSAVTGQAGASGVSQLWYVDATGQLSVARVRTGLTDGQYTQITGGPELVEGLQVIASVSQTGGSTEAVANPFQQPQQQGGPGRGRGGF